MSAGIGGLLLGLLIVAGAITAFILLVIFIAVPVFQGIGGLIGAIFKGIGWLVTHVFTFVGGMLKDMVRFVGALIALVVFMPLVPLSVVLGRWSAAGHYADWVKKECRIGGACVYRVLLQRPLRLLLLDGLLEGLEQRVPEAVHDAPTSDQPSRRTGQFDGYTIVGSLRGGGSGAKLYVAEPTMSKRARIHALTDRVVIKSFALSDGSSLPQIVRESRALECAKQLGHVLDHGMDDHRFFYVMPFIPGDHLGTITRQLHGESDGAGLGQRQLASAMHHIKDLLATLSAYHKGGLWHKDVKPENVIVHDGRAHLVDLGLVTPLRSAMTLTTHGTEYFRDPEMVRQALRGVKVHQVDGAKFDIYAAGAVLYFMIENTFPAHGGLSAFARRSPEALRWIVRRAMADYNKRYETAETMLADMHAVSAAADPFALKPADLPSMRGGVVMPEIDVPRLNQPHFAPAMAGAGATVASAGTAPPRGEPVSLPAGSLAGGRERVNVPRRRPGLRVTNWWTGAYAVDAPGPPGLGEGEAAAAGNDAKTFREAARTLRHDAARMASAARARGGTARISAREQIKSARARAAELRRRARTHRHRAVAERQPSFAVIAVTLLVMAVCAVIVAVAITGMYAAKSEAGRRRAEAQAHSFQPLPESVRDSIVAALNADPNRRLLVMAAEGNGGNGAVLPLHNQVARDFRNFTVKSETRLEQQIRPLFAAARSGNHAAAQRISEMLSKNGYAAAIVYDNDRTNPYAALFGDSAAAPALAGGDAPIALPAGSRLVVVNDHPTPAHASVRAQVEGVVAACRARGIEALEVHPQVEAALRLALARREFDPQGPAAAELAQLLSAHELTAILHVTAPPGAGDAHQRVRIAPITAPELASSEAESSPKKG